MVNIKGQVADEQGVTLGANGVTVSLGAVGGAGLGVGVGGTGVGVVEVDGTATKVLALHGLVRLGARLGVVEVDVTEATAAAAVPLSHDTSAIKTGELLEGLVETIIIDAPTQAADEKGSGAVSLGLLWGLVDVLLSLALLGGSGLSLLGIGLVGLGRIRVIGIVRVRARVRVGVGLLSLGG